MDLRNFPMDKQKCRLNLEACKSILRLFNRRMASMGDKREGFALAGAALEVKVVAVPFIKFLSFWIFKSIKANSTSIIKIHRITKPNSLVLLTEKNYEALSHILR